jgi:glucosamine--fructose-6-phosphate aminotransferase (isomerizing)
MTCMRDEIQEQPGVVAGLATRRELFLAAAREARAFGARFVLCAARGTSDNAAVYGKYLATIVAGLPAGLAAPSAVTVYDARLDLRGCLVFGISQSGETSDVTEYVARASAQGAFTVAVTNDAASPLAREAHHVLATQAGRERAIAATKTYTSQLAALALFWAAWVGDEQTAAALEGPVPAAMAGALDAEEAARAIAARLAHADRLIVAGRGYNYATALEAALKLKETSYVAAMPFSAADLRHGPIAMVEARYPALVFAPDGRARAGMLELAADLLSRGAETYVVAGVGSTVKGSTVTIALPAGIPEPLSPLVAIVPAQLIALYLALERGLDPDTPRGLTKVTRTR